MVAALDKEEETPESNLADAKQLQDDHHQVLQKSSLVAAASPVKGFIADQGVQRHLHALKRNKMLMC